MRHLVKYFAPRLSVARSLLYVRAPFSRVFMTVNFLLFPGCFLGRPHPSLASAGTNIIAPRASSSADIVAFLALRAE